MTIKRKCKICKKDFIRKSLTLKQVKGGRGKFCSRVCFHKYFTRNFMTGKKNNLWKGKKVSYSGIHAYVRRHKANISFCELCEKTGLTSRQLNCASIDHKYLRDLKNWIKVCVPCHRKLDLV